MDSAQVQRLKHCKLFSGDPELLDLYRKAFPHSDDGDKNPYPKNSELLEKIAARIVTKYYPAYDVKPVTFEITEPSTTEYADVLFEPGHTEVPPFRLPANTFESPAALAAALGHEMVHQLQIQRKYTVYMLGLNDAAKNFWELEAYTWGLGSGTFQWKIGPNRFLDYLTPDEAKELKANQEEYKQNVRKAICEVLTGPRKGVYAAPLGLWIESQDPWTSTVWVKDGENKNWRDWKDC